MLVVGVKALKVVAVFVAMLGFLFLLLIHWVHFAFSDSSLL
jgi:hypothetical protein